MFNGQRSLEERGSSASSDGDESMVVIIAAIVIAVLALTYPAFVISGRLSEREERERE